jgi:hypothetical protein
MKNRIVNWVIDKGMFEDYEDKLVAAIHKSGMEVVFFDDSKHQTKIGNFLGNRFVDQYDDVIIFHGSLQHGRGVLKSPFYPGIYLALENYECYNYYGYFGEHLLNSQYLMMGLNDVVRNKWKIFSQTFRSDRPQDEAVFIRPSNGFKSFPGQTLPLENFEFEFNVLLKSYGGLDLNTLVVISPAKDIEEEYRFIVIDGKVVSGSMYMDKASRSEWKAYYDRGCEDPGVMDFAVEMSKIYQPDRAYTLDVCRLPDGSYKLIELNSFCCASMYGNDYDKVVDAVNNLCIRDFEDIM